MNEAMVVFIRPIDMYFGNNIIKKVNIIIFSHHTTHPRKYRMKNNNIRNIALNWKYVHIFPNTSKIYFWEYKMYTTFHKQVPPSLHSRITLWRSIASLHMKLN